MKPKSKTVFLLTLGLFFLLALIDKFLIQKFLPAIYQISSFKTELFLGKAKIHIPGLSVLTFIIIPLPVLALIMIPYKTLFSSVAWKVFWERYRKIVIQSFWMPVLLFLGALIYLIFKGIMPEIIKNISELFSISFNFSIASSSFFELELGFIGILGLIIGYIIWYRKGFKSYREIL